MKKTISLFLALFLVAALTLTAFAKGTPTVSCNDDIVSVKEGEILEITITASNADAVDLITIFDIDYEKSLLELQDVKLLLSADGFLVSDYIKEQGKILFNSLENINMNGALCKLIFKVTDHVPDELVGKDCFINWNAKVGYFEGTSQIVTDVVGSAMFAIKQTTPIENPPKDPGDTTTTTKPTTTTTKPTTTTAKPTTTTAKPTTTTAIPTTTTAKPVSTTGTTTNIPKTGDSRMGMTLAAACLVLACGAIRATKKKEQ